MGEVALHKADYVGAQRLYEEALEIQQRLNYARGIGMAYSNLGCALYFQGKNGEALAALGQSLVILRALGDKEKLSIAIENLGVTHTRMGEVEQALGYHREALQLSREMDDLQGIASSLACIAAALAMNGEFVRAVRLWGAALARWEKSEAPMLPAHRERFMPELNSALNHLDSSTVEALMCEGASMELQQTLDEVDIQLRMFKNCIHTNNQPVTG
jgi:tetratricopeptide (TPR) repeat protein